MSSQNILGWIVALIVGVVAGWLVSRRAGERGASNEKEALNARLRSCERDLETARGELNSQTGTLNSLKNELVTTSTELKSREVELGVLEERIKSLEAIEKEQETAQAEFNALKADFDSINAKLAEAQTQIQAAAEPITKQPAAPDDNLQAEISSLRQSLTAKDAEIATLLGRIKELAPLKLQIADRDLRLREWSGKHAEAVKTIQAKDDELVKLTAQLDELGAACQQAEEKLASHQSATPPPSSPSGNPNRDDEVAELHDRIAELESLLKSQTNYEARIKELTDDHNFTLGEKDSLLADLQEQVSAIDAKLQSAGAADANQTEALRDKDAAISLLQLRVKELEPLTLQLAERDAKLRRLEENVQLAHSAEQIGTEKDTEIARLQTRIGELETVTTLPTIDETQLRQLEARYQAALSEKDAALAEKTAELVRLQSLAGVTHSDASAHDDAATAKLQEIEAEYRAEISDRDAELAKFKARIAELEPLHAQLFARDARLIELEARVQGLTSEKDREINRLNLQIAELTPAGAQAEAAEAKLREMENRYHSVLNSKEVEISGLRVKLAGLEGLTEQLEDRLSKLRETEGRPVAEGV